MKMKYSIRWRITVVFSAVLVAMLVSCWLVNNFFLERYYVRNKQMVLLGVYEQLNQAAQQEVLETEEFVQRLSVACDTDNISLFVMESDGQGILSSVKDSEFLKKRLYMYLFLKMDGGKILKETELYAIRMNVDVHMNSEYLELVGALNDGKQVLVRTALEPIRESVVLANRFLAYVGISVLLMGTLIIQLLSRRIAGPILELAMLSERMSNLDFNVKFSGSGKDEIAFLGNHMNQLSETLERTISELKTANNELQRDIEQRERLDEMRKEFLSNVSHELKTPIALIQGYAEGLKEGINDDEESREFYCDVIMDEASRMNALVRNLLTLNKLEAGNDIVNMERFDVAALAKNYIASADILIRQKEISVRMEDYDPIYVWGDEFRVEEVFMNYFTNAINHALGDRIIDVKMVKDGERVRISVFNTGNSIPEECVEHLWEKFYKVDKARSREYGGSGIGLSIVKAVMESMNQKYGVINYDNGVEFWFELDMA